MEDDERTNAMGLFNFAHSYWEAAVVLHNTPREATHRDSPRDYLYYHAIELYLKSYLRLREYTVSQLRKISHGLDELHDAAVRAGLTDDPGSRAVIAGVRDNYLPSRYIRTGAFSRPSPEGLWGVCRLLHNEIEPQINAAWNITRTRSVPFLLDEADGERKSLT